MKYFKNWFKRNKPPRLKAKARALFDSMEYEKSEQWETIAAYFEDCEEPPSELVYAAFQAFLASKDGYQNGLMQEAFAIREELIITISAMMGEDKNEPR